MRVTHALAAVNSPILFPIPESIEHSPREFGPCQGHPDPTVKNMYMHFD